MSEVCETVKVCADNEDGYMIINKSDMSDSHKLFSNEPKKRGPKPKNKGTEDK